MRACAADVLVCRDPEAAAVEVAGRIACTAARAVGERGLFAMAIPGGSSPRRVFELLAPSTGSGCTGSRIPWGSTHVFFTDERCVPPDHEDSNYRLARELLLSRVPLPESHIHRFRTELDPEDAASDYNGQIRAVLGDEPRIDLVLLGMGADTHTASLFPHSPALAVTDRLAAVSYVAKLDAHRLTLTFPTLNAARSVVILATGREKATAMREALQEKMDVEAHPVQGVRPVSGRLVWVVDQEAASEL